MNDEQIVKTFKQMQESINELTLKMEHMLLEKHNENSEAIDNIIVSMLGGDSLEG